MREKGIRETLVEHIQKKVVEMRVGTGDDPGDPKATNDKFYYNCGLKSISTESTEPRPASPGEQHLPVLYYGYGGVDRNERPFVEQPQDFGGRYAVQEVPERLNVIFFIQFVKFKNDDNLLETSARIHDMIGQFVTDLALQPENIGWDHKGNLEDARIISVSPMVPGRGPGIDKWLIFEIEISFTYLREAQTLN